ncbi:MAG: cytochrome P450 [Deltaproteobacteria bacterium]|nr:cytochrome P450 [Deltaproteobacteria bacterium]
MADPRSETHERDLADIDLTESELYRQGFPHEIFARLRREAPVHWQPVREELSKIEENGFWVLSKYHDIQAANRDTELFSAIDGPALSHNPEMSGAMLVSMDGRDHNRQRRLISAGFTPRMVGRIEQQARRWAVSIVDEALERGTCNFVHDVAYQLPMHMIADILGIPVEDRQWLFTLTTDFLQAGDPEHPISQEQQMAIQVEMFQYAQELGRKKRADPQDDIWTILSTVEIETDEGERAALSEIELDFFFLLLTVAGSETTRSAISVGLLALLDHPDQLETLRNDPSAMRPAVEEILRWSSPVSYFARRATRDTEVRGVPIAEGQRVTFWYPSGNRDEEVWDDPSSFDIHRTPQQHLAFGGGGPHFCLGANLARREIAILFEELLARTREIELLAPPSYSALSIYNPILVALKELPVRLS